MALDADKFILPDGVPDPVTEKQKTKSSTLGIANILDKLSVLAQTLLGSINFAAGKRVLYDGVPIELPELGNWTPEMYGLTTAGTYTLENVRATYKKQYGKMYIEGSFGFSVASGGSGLIVFDGIPEAYAAGLVGKIIGQVQIVNVAGPATKPVSSFVGPTASGVDTKLYPYVIEDGGGAIGFDISGVTTASTFTFNLEYEL